MKVQKRLLAILVSVSLLLGSFGATFGIVAGALSESAIFNYGTLSDNFDTEGYNAATYWEQIGLSAYTEKDNEALVKAYTEAQTVTTADSYAENGKGLRLASYSSVHEVDGALRYSTYALKENFDGRKVLNMSGDITSKAWNDEQKQGVAIVYYYEDAYNWRGFMLFGSCVRHIVSFSDGSTVYTCNTTRSPQFNYSNLTSKAIAQGVPVHFEVAYAADGSSVTLNLTQGETKLVTNYTENGNVGTKNYKSYNKDEWTTSTTLRNASASAVATKALSCGLNATNKIAFACSYWNNTTTTLDNLVINFGKTASDFTEQFAALNEVTAENAGDHIAEINKAIAFYDELSETVKADDSVAALYNHIQDLIVGMEGADYIKAYESLGNLTSDSVDEATNNNIKAALNAYTKLSSASQQNDEVKALYNKITEAYFRYNRLTAGEFTDDFTYTDVPVSTVWEQIASGADKTVSVTDGKLVLNKNSANISSVVTFWNGDKIPMVALKDQLAERNVEQISGNLYLNTRYSDFNRGAIFVYYYKDAYNWRGLALTLAGLRHLVVASTVDENGTTVYSKHDINLRGTAISELYKNDLAQFTTNPVNFSLTYNEDGTSVNFVLKYNEAEIYNVNISNDLPQNEYNLTSVAAPTTNKIGNTDPESKIPELKDENGNLTTKLNAARFAFGTVAGQEDRYISNLTVKFTMNATDFKTAYKSLETATAADYDSALAEAALADYAKLSDADKETVKALYEHINKIVEQRTYAPLMSGATISTTGDRIRFTSSLANVKEGANITEYGTLFTYSAYITNGTVSYDDMVCDTENSLVAVAKSNDVSGLSKAGDAFYGGSFIIAPKYYGYRIVARSYVKYDDGTVYYSVNDAADSTGGTSVTDGVKGGFATRSIISISKKILGAVYSNKDNAAVEMSDTLKTGITEYISAMDAGKITWTEKAMGTDKSGKPIVDFITENAADISSALSSIIAQG